jgi:FtsX-like permease family
MRLFTYIGLVARRVWAKKGILFGSLLGATLVIALLVVVPLYESSVQAVDLKFTLSGAVGDELDTTAFSQMNQYTGVTGATNRAVVRRAHADWLGAWYPGLEERTQSREFLVIPSGVGTPFDWFEAAAAWREEIAALEEGGVPVEEWPPAPYPTPPQDATQLRFFTAPNVAEIIDVVEGELPWPVAAPPGGDDEAPLPIVLGADVAARIGAGVGDRFFLRPFSGFPETFELVEIAALVAAIDPDDPIWGIDDPGGMVYFDQLSFDTWLAQVQIDAGDDPWLRQTRGFPDTGVTQRFRLPLDTEQVELQDLEQLEGSLAQFRGQINRESGGTIPTNTFLPQLLAEFRTRSVTVGGPILAMLALVVGGAIYFLVYTAALTVEREGAEMAQLKSRGASSWQTIGIHVAQSLLIVIVAVLVAPFVARALVGITGRVPPLDDLTGGQPLDVAQIRSLRPWLFAGGLIAFVAMGVAVIPYARRGVLSLRALASRPGQKSVWQRYNLDLFAIALSLVMLFQLSERGFINTSGEEVTLDPLAIAFPVLLLFTGALILLRVFPFLLRFVGWLMTKSRSMSMALPGWHLGRNPVPYGRLALLVWVTTGLGAFALTYAATLQGSFDDRAAYAAGADVRVIGEGAGYLEASEGDIGTPVLRTSGAPRRSGRQAEALAVRPTEFAEVVAWREDFGPATPEEIFSALRPDGAAPDVGVEVPEGTVALAMDGVVIPEPWALQVADPDRDSSHRFLVRVIDAGTRVWTMAADTEWTAEGWATATIDLSTALNTTYLTPPEPPFSIHSWWIERASLTAGFAVDGSTLLVGELRAIDGDGAETVLDLSEMTPINQLGWQGGTAADEAARAYYSQIPEGETVTEADIRTSPLYREGTAFEILTPERTRGNPAVPQLRRIPDDLNVLLDVEAAAIAGLSVGDDSSYGIAGQIYNGQLVGLVERVPTMTDRRLSGKMVLDLDALNAWLNGAASWSLLGTLSRVDGPQELWVETDSVDAAVRRLSTQDEEAEVLTIRGSAASFASRPVQVGLVAILFVGAATGVVLALAGVTGYVLLAVSRRAREMGVLRALGFGRTGVGTTFAMEQVVVIGLGAVIGVFGGIALTTVMIPFLQLGETAEVVEPPIALIVPWSSLLIYVGIVGVLLVLSVLWATRRVSVRRMSEVLREVER